MYKHNARMSAFYHTSVLLSCLGTVQGGRYSDPNELNKLVVPLVIVAVILVVMLTLVGVFYWRKRRCQCGCCALLVQSRHSLMKDQTHCHCGDTCRCLKDGTAATTSSHPTEGLTVDPKASRSPSGVVLPSKTYSSDSHSAGWGQDGGPDSLDCGLGVKNEAKCAVCCRCEENASRLRSWSLPADRSHSGPQPASDESSSNQAQASSTATQGPGL